MKGKEYYRRAFICDSLSDYHDRIGLQLNRIHKGLSYFGHPAQLNVMLYSAGDEEERLIDGLTCSKSVEIYCAPTFKIKAVFPFDRTVHGAFAGLYNAFTFNKIDLNVGKDIHYGDSKKTECYLMKITELYEKNSREGDWLAETHLTLEAIKSNYC